MKKLIPVLLLTFVNTLSFSILIPVLPFMVRNWQLPDWVFGIMLAIFSFCQFWAAPIFGQLSDQHGRRKILLITQGGTFVSWLIFIGLWFIESIFAVPVFGLLFMLTVVRVIDGITGGNSSVTNAYLSDVTTQKQKATYFGYLSAAMGVGIIIGPAIGAYTMASSINYLATTLVGASISLITLISIYFLLPESLTNKEPRSQIHWLKPFKIAASFSALNGQLLIRNVLIVRLFLGATLASYTSVMVFYLIDQFALDKTEIGHFLFFVGSFAIFNQLILIKPIVQLCGETRALALGLGLISLSLAMFPLLNQYWQLLVTYYFANLGFSICMPTIKSMLATQTNSQHQGEILGLEESLGSLMMAIMPIASTWIYVHIGVSSFWFWSSVTGLALLFLITACTNTKSIK